VVRWSEYKAKLIEKNWNKLTLEEIGELVGASESSVRRKATKLKLGPKIHRQTWDSEQKERAVLLRERGWGVTRIAADLGISRNAVIGFFWRRGKPIKRQPRIRSTPILRRRIVTYSEPSKPIPPSCEPIHLVDRHYQQCAYIVDNQLCCGAPVHSSSSWCRYHYYVVFKQRS
jgi:hypothetical protein